VISTLPLELVNTIGQGIDLREQTGPGRRREVTVTDLVALVVEIFLEPFRMLQQLSHGHRHLTGTSLR
jgi:hypothetical protein